MITEIIVLHGSSKAIGPNVVYALWNAAPEQHVKFSTYVRDDGFDTQPPLQNLPYAVQKCETIPSNKIIQSFKSVEISKWKKLLLLYCSK